jgi:hypothetical protein
VNTGLDEKFGEGSRRETLRVLGLSLCLKKKALVMENKELEWL